MINRLFPSVSSELTAGSGLSIHLCSPSEWNIVSVYSARCIQPALTNVCSAACSNQRLRRNIPRQEKRTFVEGGATRLFAQFLCSFLSILVYEIAHTSIQERALERSLCADCCCALSSPRSRRHYCGEDFCSGCRLARLVACSSVQARY